MKRTTFWWQEWEQKLSNSWWQVNPALNREGQAERTHCMQIKETLQWNCANSQNLEQTELVVSTTITTITTMTMVIMTNKMIMATMATMMTITTMM